MGTHNSPPEWCLPEGLPVDTTIEKGQLIELPPDLSNLQDLIELETIGERVIWPNGLDANSASTLISDWLSGRTHREDNSAAL